MIKWDKVVVNDNKITITVDGKEYNGKLAENGRFYDMGYSHIDDCDKLFGIKTRSKIQKEFKTLGGSWPETHDPKQFAKDYFEKYNTGKDKFIDLLNEF